ERCENCGAWTDHRDKMSPGSEPAPAAIGLEERVRSLLAEGRKIEAIRAYRESTGAGLKEAKDVVDALEQGGPFGGRDDAAVDPDSELLELLGRGQKIQAIKVYRERTRAGLKEAKEAVEALARSRGLAPKGAGCSGAAALL